MSDPCVSDDVISIPTTHCFQCENWLCSYHAHKHRSHDGVHSYDAVLADPDLKSRVDKQARVVITSCGDRTQNIISQYCIDCDQLVCDQCIRSSHATHRHEHINTTISNLVTSSNSLIQQVTEAETTMSSHMTALTRQQQSIESEQDVLNAMSTKIAQLSSQVSVRKLCLDDEMLLMSATHAAMSSACQQLNADLAARDYNKIRASVDQLQTCYDTCSRSVISHQPAGHISCPDILSSLLKANACLSAVCVRLSNMSRSLSSYVSDDDQQLLVASMLSWMLAQQLNMSTRLIHDLPLQRGFVKLIDDQLVTISRPLSFLYQFLICYHDGGCGWRAIHGSVTVCCIAP